MNCIYKFNGKTFNTELELDSEILRLNSITNNIHDLVFSKTYSEISEEFNSILMDAQKDYEELQKANSSLQKYQAADIKELYEAINAGEDVLEIIKSIRKRGYASVTEMLHGVVNSEGHPLFPIFNFDNYWKTIVPKLKKIKSEGWVGKKDVDGKVVFSEDLCVLLFGSLDQVHDVTEDELDYYKERLSEQLTADEISDGKVPHGIWPGLAIIGTLTHEIMSEVLSQDLKIPNDQLRKKFENNLTAKIHRALAKAKANNNGMNVFPDEKAGIMSIIDSALLIREHVKKNYNNPRVYCELKIVGDAIYQLNPLKILGSIDLLVLDDDGKVGIFDYKCSPKDFKDFDPAKVRTFEHLLAVYRRLIENLGIQSEKRIAIYAIPVKFKNFRYDDKGTEKTPESVRKNGYITFDGIELESIQPEKILRNLDDISNTDVINSNINLIVPERPKLVDSDDIIGFTNDFMLTCFPEYSDFKSADDATMEKRILEVIENNGGIQKEEGTNTYYVFFKKNNKFVKANSEVAVVDAIKTQWKEARSAAKNRAANLKDLLLKSQEGSELFSYKAKGIVPENGNLQWSEQILKKYANGNWEVLTSKKKNVQNVLNILEAHGVLLIQNKSSKVIDVIKCTADDILLLNNLGPKSNRRKYILGTFLSDDVSTNTQDNLVLQAVNGNIELMETMALLNAAAGTLSKYGAVIGDVTVVNTLGRNGVRGLSASNELLMYNFRRLCTLGKFEYKFGMPTDPNFLNSIKMCSYVDLVRKQLTDLKVRYNNDDRGLLIFKDIVDYSVIDTKNKELLKEELLQLKEKLEEQFPYLSKNISGDTGVFDYINSPEYKLYTDLLQAIAEVEGVKIVQLIGNHPKFFDSVSTILLQGLNGSYTDNPGTLKSLNLNKLAYTTEKAYLNVRVSMTRFNEEFLKHLKKFKDSKSFNWILKITFGNLASIYLNLYDDTAKKYGKLQFRSFEDPRLNSEEKEFLIYCVLKLAFDRKKIDRFTINKNGQFDEDAFWAAYAEVPDLVLQVPLVRASWGSTIASSGGVINAVKAVFSQLAPKNLKNFLTGRVYEFLDVKSNDDSQKLRAKSGDLFEMINRIQNSYDEDLRERLLNPVGQDSQVDLFETNLETLVLSSAIASNMKTELDKIFPTLKAIIVSLGLQGTILNTKFTDDLLYALDYIKNKIHGLPLEDLEKFGLARTIVTELMSGASKLALAFNPLQLYLVIDGLWKDIMLMAQKPDVNLPDETAFTKQNMLDSFMWIVSDIKHFGDKPTLGEALNRLYGINDMDINKFHHAISTDNAGIYNFWSLGFRFTSRPDYYNRMTIFGALMRKDGCFEAHSMSEDGELIYDWTKDKRFDKYAAGDRSDLELYNKQKALYLAMAQEFIEEGATNADGTLFTINNDEHPTALPRAYTTKQSESMKALGDKIYGYYSHEKRSMIQSYTLGAMFMQMHTYWSSKKNQYLSGHGFTLQGNYEQYQETQVQDGKERIVKYWQVLNDQGNLEIVSDDLVGDKEKIPYMVWKGRPLEGIVVTFMNMARDLLIGQHDENGDIAVDEDGNKMRGWSYMFDKHFGEHVDAKLRTLYHANMSQLAYDLFMLLLLGAIVAPALSDAADKHIKATGNKSFNDALNNSCLYGLTKMLLTSADDFNMLKSIGGQVTDWNPFSLSMMTRSIIGFKDLFVSDKDSYDILVGIPTATRNLKPMFDYAKYSVTGRHIGEKSED